MEKNSKTVAEIERLRRQLREDLAPPVTVDAGHRRLRKLWH